MVLVAFNWSARWKFKYIYVDGEQPYVERFYSIYITHKTPLDKSVCLCIYIYVCACVRLNDRSSDGATWRWRGELVRTECAHLADLWESVSNYANLGRAKRSKREHEPNRLSACVCIYESTTRRISPMWWTIRSIATANIL